MTAATEELTALAAEHQRLVQHRRGIDQEERDAWAATRPAEDELAGLEREALAGDPPPQAQFREVQKKAAARPPARVTGVAGEAQGRRQRDQGGRG